ncbi:MAG: glycosyltransferase family 2 protein [Candidatus Zhuqueibacterota bacterium]
MNRVSVILITLNEERNIVACLESVKWADEIIIVDSHSIDRTRELAAAYTGNIFDMDWEGYSAAKNFALARANGDWVLWIDADERVTPELRQEIQQAIREKSEIAGYEIPRKAYFLGRWIKHCGWYPGYVLRLFKRGSAFFNASHVHEGLELSGRRGRLRHPLLHYTDRDIDHYYTKFNRYTSLAIDDLMARNKKFTRSDLIFRPLYAFFKMYILKQGFLDGMQGFLLCVFSANYVFTKYAKLWEREILANEQNA